MNIWIPTYAGNVNYDRPKSPEINDTPINVDFLAGEEPTAPAALTGDNSGTSGILNLTLTADADESGGVDIQDLFRIEDLRVVIDVTTGLTKLTATIIPVLGDESDAATPTVLSVNHPETMDAWQTAAGRPRQV